MLKMIEEARILSDTYSNGVGIYAFQENADGTAYGATKIPKGVAGRVTSFDNVLGVMAAEIKQIMSQHGGHIPPPGGSKP